jgi:hypothetical protein
VTKEVDAWPFIASRNPTLDWRPILAPDFLIEARADYLLLTETASPDPHPLWPTIEEKVVESARAGTVTLLFSSFAATNELLGEESDEQLLDGFGRPIHVVLGLVFRGRQHVPRSEQEAAVESVRSLTVKHFPAFWHEEREDVGPQRSEAMQATTDAPPTCSATLDTYGSAEAPRTWLFALGVAAITVAAAIWWWRTRGS